MLCHLVHECHRCLALQALEQQWGVGEGDASLGGVPCSLSGRLRKEAQVVEHIAHGGNIDIGAGPRALSPARHA